MFPVVLAIRLQMVMESVVLFQGIEMLTRVQLERYGDGSTTVIDVLAAMVILILTVLDMIMVIVVEIARSSH